MEILYLFIISDARYNKNDYQCKCRRCVVDLNTIVSGNCIIMKLLIGNIGVLQKCRDASGFHYALIAIA